MAETALITPTTKLEAVNWALRRTGFLPVSTLEGNIGRMASTGLQTIDFETRSVCRKGYWFNRRNVKFEPTVDKYLIPAANVLLIRPPSEDCTLTFNSLDWPTDRPTLRQGKVYSIIRQSYEFPLGLTAEIVEALPFEDCAEEARVFVMIKAALAINDAFVRSEHLTKEVTPLLNLAWSDLQDAELENSKYRFI